MSAVGTVSVLARSAVEIAAVMRGAAGQTADLQQWQDNTGAVGASIERAGALNVTPIAAVNGYSAFVKSPSASVVPLMLRGAASQTGNLQEWQKSDGTALAAMKPQGSTAQLALNMFANADAPLLFKYGAGVTSTSTTKAIDFQNSSGTSRAYFDADGGYYPLNGMDVAGARGASQHALLVSPGNGVVATAIQAQGGAGAVDIQQWLANTTGTVVAGITASGSAYFGGSAQIASAKVSAFSTATTAIPIAVRGFAGQTADLQEWQDSTGAILARISSAGDIVGNSYLSLPALKTGNYSPSGNVHMAARGTTEVTSVVRGFASQTADLQQWQDSTGAVLAKLQSNGTFWTNAAAGITTGGIATSGPYLNAAASINTTGTSLIGVAVRGVVGQTADLQQWQDTTGTALTRVDPSGRLSVQPSGTSAFATANAALGVTPQSLGLIGIAVKALAGQTGDLTQWQDSAGSILSGVNASGNLRVVSPGYGSSLSVGTPAVGQVNAIIRGIVSQTADMQQWQDSGGGRLLSVDSAGKFAVNGGTDYIFKEATDGPLLRMLHFPSSWSDGTKSAFFQLGSSTVTQGFFTGYQGSIMSRFGISSAGTTITDNAYSTLPIPGAILQVQRTSTATAASPVMIVKGAATQTGDLTQWQNSAGGISAKVDSNGGIYGQTFYGGGVSGSIAGAPLSIAGVVATNPVAVIRGAASQSADLEQWQNSGGTVLAKIGAAGAAQFAAAHINTAGLGATLDVVTAGAAVVPIIARGAAAQTANMQEWQNSGGTVLAMQRPNGEYEQTVNAVAASDVGGGAGGIILKSPAGTRYRLTVSNTPAVVLTAA
jgi:hypothetical protein